MSCDRSLVPFAWSPAIELAQSPPLVSSERCSRRSTSPCIFSRSRETLFEFVARPGPILSDLRGRRDRLNVRFHRLKALPSGSLRVPRGI